MWQGPIKPMYRLWNVTSWITIKLVSYATCRYNNGSEQLIVPWQHVQFGFANHLALILSFVPYEKWV